MAEPYQSGTRITDPAELRRIFNMPTATAEESERARSTDTSLGRAQNTLGGALNAAREALGIPEGRPFAGTGAVAERTDDGIDGLLSAFNPVRWLAGGAGVALIIGGIIIAVK